MGGIARDLERLEADVGDGEEALGLLGLHLEYHEPLVESHFPQARNPAEYGGTVTKSPVYIKIK